MEPNSSNQNDLETSTTVKTSDQLDSLDEQTERSNVTEIVPEESKPTEIQQDQQPITEDKDPANTEMNEGEMGQLDSTKEQTDVNNEEMTSDQPDHDVSNDSTPRFDLSHVGEEDRWLFPQFDAQKKTNSILRPDEIQDKMRLAPLTDEDRSRLKETTDRVRGSMVGMAIGDALGAHVEFRPRSYLEKNPVENFSAGGTWGLKEGQFTDDTSMALCLATSLISKKDFSAYDQLVRYKWWYKYGFLSSTGECFDIGNATRESVEEFSRRQSIVSKENNLHEDKVDLLDKKIHKELEGFDCHCSEEGVAGNGALMRLCPVPLFFHGNPGKAVFYSGESGILTHGDTRVRDACEYYGALIVAAVRGASKEDLLDDSFCEKHPAWFSNRKFHDDIESISKGSYRKNGYEEGIRGSGFIVKALEAALWAFWSTNDFKSGALAAVNLGDDTDTTAAIYGQLAGAHYGYDKLDKSLSDRVFAKEFIENLSDWIVFEGEAWSKSFVEQSQGEMEVGQGNEPTEQKQENNAEPSEKSEAERKVDPIVDQDEPMEVNQQGQDG